MGVDLGDIVVKRSIDLKDLENKVVAIDAYNTLYQFLASIRMADGTPLVGPDGEPTSHLEGLLTRTGRLLASGIKPIYVFDGKPIDMKADTITQRIERRKKAEEEYLEALKRGDLVEAAIKARQSTRLTARMVEEAKTLLEHLGIPYVVAKSEGEAQASYIVMKGDAYAVGSQDYDTLLFGTPRLIRNLAITGKRRLPRQNRTITVRPEIIDLSETLKHLGITRKQLIDIAILVGTDFNEGIKGIGPKKGLKYIKEKGNLENFMAEKGIVIDYYEKVRKIFLEPEINEDYVIEWRPVDDEATIEYLCKNFNFNPERVKSALENYHKFQNRYMKQSTIDAWF